MIKKLNYISNINKNQKQMKILIQQPIKNLKILYNENERQIKYEEYYFNGFPIPKNIKITNKNTNSFKLLWEIDNLSILNTDTTTIILEKPYRDNIFFGGINISMIRI